MPISEVIHRHSLSVPVPWITCTPRRHRFETVYLLLPTCLGYSPTTLRTFLNLSPPSKCNPIPFGLAPFYTSITPTKHHPYIPTSTYLYLPTSGPIPCVCFLSHPLHQLLKSNQQSHLYNLSHILLPSLFPSSSSLSACPLAVSPIDIFHISAFAVLRLPDSFNSFPSPGLYFYRHFPSLDRRYCSGQFSLPNVTRWVLFYTFDPIFIFSVSFPRLFCGRGCGRDQDRIHWGAKPSSPSLFHASSSIFPRDHHLFLWFPLDHWHSSRYVEMVRSMREIPSIISPSAIASVHIISPWLALCRPPGLLLSLALNAMMPYIIPDLAVAQYNDRTAWRPPVALPALSHSPCLQALPLPSALVWLNFR